MLISGPFRPQDSCTNAPEERRVIRGGKVHAHHPEERMQEPLRLSEWQVEEETERQCGFDGDVGILSLPSPSACACGRPATRARS